MKKFANVRLPILCACTLIAGTVLALVIQYLTIGAYWLAIVPAIIVIPFAIAAALKKSVKPLVFMGFALFFLVCGSLNCYFRLVKYSDDDVAQQEIYKISGIVSDKSDFGSSRYVIIDNVNIDGNRRSEKFLVYVNDNEFQICDVGYSVSFHTKELKIQDPFTYGKLNYNVQKNIKYYCNAVDDLQIEYRFSLFRDIQSSVRATLFENLDKDIAAICYGMLIGDTDYIEENTLQSMRFGGIAHVFAVSGLHIGIIFGILSFICKKLKLNKFLTATICILSIFFYSGICGFTVSSVRAVIMCGTATLAKLLYSKNDNLNSLALAVIAALFVNPFSLVTVGFQLSVCAVVGIFLLSKNVDRTLKRIKCPAKISSAIGVSFGAQAGTLPVMLANFGYLSGAGLLLNVLILPLISALFAIVFAAVIICSVIAPAAPFLMPAATAPLSAVISFFVNAGFEKALISGFGAGAFVPLYCVAILTISDKLNLKRLARLIAAGCSVVILASFVLFQTYMPVSGFKICVSAYSGGENVIIKSSQGTVLILTESVKPTRLKTSLNKFYSTDLQGVIILGGEDCVNAFGKAEINCKNVYVCKLYTEVQPYEKTVVHYEKNFSLCGADYEFADGYTVTASYAGIKTCITASKQNPIESCDLLISKYDNATCYAKSEVFFNLSGRLFNNYDYGDITLLARNGKLKMQGVLPKKQRI